MAFKVTAIAVWTILCVGCACQSELTAFKSSKVLHEKEKMLHVISVYEGGYPTGTSHSYNYHPDGRIDVTVKNNPNASSVVLVLTSYEPVNWYVDVQKGVKIEKIILSSYENSSKVSGIDKVQVLRESLGHPYERGAILVLSEKMKAIVGASVATAQGGYRGSIFETY